MGIRVLLPLPPCSFWRWGPDPLYILVQFPYPHGCPQKLGHPPVGGSGPSCRRADSCRLAYFWDFFDPKWSNDLRGSKNGRYNGPVVIRTLDSSQRDVPVYVVFLQGVLTVPVAVWPSETFPQGVLWCQCSSRPTQGRKRRSARVPGPAMAQI